ncbi:M23 family metallopeptidase [Arthrobacter cryoconiti]|uniref:M23 family metallopeptidase n=1 Tax=Arthrobacter cryoconiti TaxID=748907 RepID=A0ABV8QXZ2_9MICC|nr:M23 family metallopeptidase [Arthrobacter cryoconiti]MCC9068785.1 M23 family metallopeptidase [Arthrobacter cryoconiti]
MPQYIWPIPAWTGINQLFGADPASPYNPPGGHTGTDFGTPIGTPIRAIADGIVKHAGWFRGEYYDNPWLIMPTFGGIVVVIDHGPIISVYAHLNDTGLNIGDSVRQGDVIAHSGNTRSEDGGTFGPHLHFEILPDGWSVNNGTYGRVDPAIYCSGYWAGPVAETNINPENIGTTTPIQEDDMALSDADKEWIGNKFYEVLQDPVVVEAQRKLLFGDTTLRNIQGTMKPQLDQIQLSVGFQESFAVKMLPEIAKSTGSTVDLSAVKQASRAGAEEALAAGVKVDATVTLAGGTK